MKTFTLSATYNVLRNGITETCLRPSDAQIQEYLATYKVYDTEADALADTASFITEQTPILYHIFHYSDSIPLVIREQYEL
jgi:hypothetical protein